jgi:hypothetical protein
VNRATTTVKASTISKTTPITTEATSTAIHVIQIVSVADSINDNILYGDCKATLDFGKNSEKIQQIIAIFCKKTCHPFTGLCLNNDEAFKKSKTCIETCPVLCKCV